MHLSTNLDNYDLYDGTSPAQVIAKHEDNQRSWRFNMFGTKKSNKLKINPFEDVCIGVYVQPSNSSKYMISLTQTRESRLFCSMKCLNDS